MKKVLILMLLVLFVAGCGPETEEPEAPATGEAVDDPGLEPEVGDETGETVVAVVDDEEIYQTEVDEIQQMQQQQGMPVDEGMIIDQLIEMELLLQEADDRGLGVSEEEVQEELEEMLAMQGMSVEEAEQMLGPEFETLVEEQREQMLIHELIEDESEGLEEVEVSEEEKREAFDQMQAMGQIPEDETFEEAKEEIEMMLEQEQEQQVIMELLQDLEEDADVEIKADIEQPQQPEMEIQPAPEGEAEDGAEEVEVEFDME